jgi:hypothetical protein
VAPSRVAIELEIDLLVSAKLAGAFCAEVASTPQPTWSKLNGGCACARQTPFHARWSIMELPPYNLDRAKDHWINQTTIQACGLSAVLMRSPNNKLPRARGKRKFGPMFSPLEREFKAELSNVRRA